MARVASSLLLKYPTTMRSPGIEPLSGTIRLSPDVPGRHQRWDASRSSISACESQAAVEWRGKLSAGQGSPIYWPQPSRRDGRVAEGGGLLNRYRVEKLYRGFESLSLRQIPLYQSLNQQSSALDAGLPCTG